MAPNRPSYNALSRIRPFLFILFLTLLALALSSPAAAIFGNQPAAPSGRPLNPPTDQIIVRFQPAAGPMSSFSMTARLDRLSAAAGTRLTFMRPMSGGAYVFRLPTPLPERQVAAMTRDLAALPEVAHAEPDRIVFHNAYLPAQPASPASGDAPRHAAMVPDDPFFADQWHYDYVPGTKEGLNLLPAWQITTGSPDIVVAVLDSGILPHADLTGRTVPGYDFITLPARANDNDHQNQDNSRDANPADPGDWIAADGCGFPHDASASSWHGTHVAGTIGAATNNGVDVAGVDWQARILPVRVLGRCGGTASDIADAIRWAAGLAVPGAPPNANPARVINMSLGGEGICAPADAIQLAINDATAAGTVVVVSAGNDGWLADFYFPASCDSVITVAATNRAGYLTGYSNFGSVLEVAAPGGSTSPNPANGILSTLNDGPEGPGNDSLAYYQGTSMAAPHVAGVASLMLALNPALTPAQVSDLLQSTARDFPEDSGCTAVLCGEGLVDAFAVLTAVDSLTPPALLSPADGAVLDTALPPFSWTSVTGAEGYGLVIATDDTFAAGVLDTVVDTNEFTLIDPLADGTYFWRVNALAGVEFSPWSEVRSFTIDTSIVECDTPPIVELKFPVNEAYFNSGPVIFEWFGIEDVPAYDIRVDDDPNFASPLVMETTTINQYEYTTPLDIGVYYWSVRGRNNTGNCDVVGEWADTRSFLIEGEDECQMPEKPNLISPPDGSISGQLPTFTWSPAANADIYFIYVDNDSDLSSPLISKDLISTTYTPDAPLAPGVYYWGVRGLSHIEGVCNLDGPDSDVWSFTIEATDEYLMFLPATIR